MQSASQGEGNEANSQSIHSIKAMEEALAKLFASSFDADSKVCLVTLMKVLDNVLHKPGDERVRTIRLSNEAFHNKVARRPGGIEFLLACGFTRQAPPAPLLSGNNHNSSTGEQVLILTAENEKQSRLVTARRLLRQRAIQDLQMKEEELPVYREPPPKFSLVSSSSAAASSNTNSATFNPYVGHRYDAQSAAVGANLGPDSNYISPTDQQLRALQRQKAKLEQAAAQQFTDREWKAWTAGETVQWNDTNSTSNNDNATTETKSDATLLAQRAKALEAARQQREEGGFTTAAMREVAKLKNKKVYSHVQITIQFADQTKVTGKFLPKEKIGVVLKSLKDECLLEPSRELDLYVAPPRRLLPLNATLEHEGLVPAAKIFASWKVGSAPSPGQAVFHPHLFDRTATSGGVGTTGAITSFPSAQPIVLPQNKADKKPPAAAAVAKPKKKKESREESLLKRMMGKK